MHVERSSWMLETLLLAVASTGAWGAEPVAPGGTPAATDRRDAVDLVFPGGTIGEYFEALRKAAGDVNLVIMEPGIAAIRFPAVRIRSAFIGSAVELVNGRYPIENGNEYHVHAKPLGTKAQGQSDVFQIFGERIVQFRVDVKVWTLADLLDRGMKAEDVLSAVETAVNLVDIGIPAKVRFHEGTRLLVVSGNGLQNAAVGDVIDALREGNARIESPRKSEKDRNSGSSSAGPAAAPARPGGDKRESGATEK